MDEFRDHSQVTTVPKSHLNYMHPQYERANFDQSSLSHKQRWVLQRNVFSAISRDFSVGDLAFKGIGRHLPPVHGAKKNLFGDTSYEEVFKESPNSAYYDEMLHKFTTANIKHSKKVASLTRKQKPKTDNFRVNEEVGNPSALNEGILTIGDKRITIPDKNSSEREQSKADYLEKIQGLFKSKKNCSDNTILKLSQSIKQEGRLETTASDNTNKKIQIVSKVLFARKKTANSMNKVDPRKMILTHEKSQLAAENENVTNILPSIFGSSMMTTLPVKKRSKIFCCF